MKGVAFLAAALLLSGCVTTTKELAADLSTPRLALHFDKDWRTTFQAINAASLACDNSVRSAEDSATSTGTVTSVVWERIVYVVSVRPDQAGTGSDVTVLMPMHETKQRKTWPELLDRWVNQNDRSTCPADIWRA